MSCGDNDLAANVKFEFFLDRTTPVCNPQFAHTVKAEVILIISVINCVWYSGVRALAFVHV